VVEGRWRIRLGVTVAVAGGGFRFVRVGMVRLVGWGLSVRGIDEERRRRDRSFSGADLSVPLPATITSPSFPVRL
jgi:hypothetical protein